MRVFFKYFLFNRLHYYERNHLSGDALKKIALKISTIIQQEDSDMHVAGIN